MVRSFLKELDRVPESQQIIAIFTLRSFPANYTYPSLSRCNLLPSFRAAARYIIRRFEAHGRLVNIELAVRAIELFIGN